MTTSGNTRWIWKHSLDTECAATSALKTNEILKEIYMKYATSIVVLGLFICQLSACKPKASQKISSKPQAPKSAFFVATVKVKDSTKFSDYAQKAGVSMKAFGGEIIQRGKMREVLVGKADHNGVGIVRFPDLESLNNWYASPAYQAIIPLRDEAADITIVAYEIPN